MARQPRVFLPNMSVHVIHRGNNRMALFRSNDDYTMLLALMQRATVQHSVDVHGYVLMTNHLHMLVTPREAAGLPRAVKQFACRYAQYYNRRYERIGTVWNGRYNAILVDSERYWLTCLRYIEQNPVRAGIAKSPDGYRWSSYAAHALGEDGDWLAPHYLYNALGATPAMRRIAYQALCSVPVTPDECVPPHHMTPAKKKKRGSDGCLTPHSNAGGQTPI